MNGTHRRAVRAAKGLIEEYGIRTPEEIDLEAIACDQGLTVIDGNLSGALARLLRKGPRGVVRISDSISYAGQRRFCIAHELGHFLLHQEHNHLALCTNEDMLAGYARGKPELEANAFAGEMLMPEALLRGFLDPKALDLESIERIAGAFDASMSASIHRIVDVGAHVCALVRCEAREIKSFHTCSDFPFRIRGPGSRLDATSCAGEFHLDGAIPEKEADVLASAWLDDPRVEGSESIREITVPMPRFNASVTLLWVMPGSRLDQVAAE